MLQRCQPGDVTEMWCCCFVPADVYLMGTVMLIFGMGVYELFISSLDIAGHNCEGKPAVCGSNLFGLFRLRVS